MAEIKPLILIGAVWIPRALIFASCAHAINAKSLLSVIARRLQAILVIFSLPRSESSTTSKYFLRLTTFSFASLVSGTHPNFAISL